MPNGSPDKPISHETLRVLKRDAGFSLAASAALSLTLHVCLAVAFYDSPMGSVDRARYERETVIRVVRADDLITRDPSPHTLGVEPGSGLDDPSQEGEPSLADLSRSLLLHEPAPQESVDRAQAHSQGASERSAFQPLQPLTPAPSIAAAAGGADLLAPSRAELPIDLSAGAAGGELSELPFVESTEPMVGQPGSDGNRGGGGGSPGARPTTAGADAAGAAAGLLSEDDASLAPVAGRSSTRLDPALAPPAPRLDPTDLGLWRGDSAPSPGPALALPRPGGEDPFKQLDTPQSLDNDFDYTLLTHRAPGESGYFRIDIRPRRTLQNLRTLPKDVVFLLDSSGSISRNWLQEVVAGVTDALDTLNPGDRFNIVVFKDTPHFLSSDRIRSVDSASLAEAKRFLLKAESGGGTDVNQALSRLLVRDVAADRVHYLILISDGVPTRGVKDTRELINAITRDNDLVAGIFCVGVGRKTDRALLDYLAYRNRGSSVFCERIEEVRPSIRDLAGRLRYPIIKDLRFAVVGVDGGEVYPKDLPNIHQSDSISIYGRYNKPGPFTMRLTGHNGQKTLDFTFKQEIPPIADHLPQIADNWAFWKLHHLYSERLRLGASPAIDRQIEALRAKHSLR